MSRIEEIRARAERATPGPWFWWGNVDNADPSLCWRQPGSGVSTVLGHLKRARHVKDPELNVDEIDEYFPDPKDQAAVINNYLFTQMGDSIYEDRLAFVENDILIEARKRAVFEVAPEVTERSDPRVYRADIKGVRHPDAEFLAHSRADVEFLLAEVDRLSHPGRRVWSWMRTLIGFARK